LREGKGRGSWKREVGRKVHQENGGREGMEAIVDIK